MQPVDATRVRDLLDLPEHIRKGDFVLKLAEGIEDARGTAASYVVTPALAKSFDQALTLVGGALRDGKSQAAYLHGSFGSGKSHFMALLSLLLAGNEEAWRIPELHGLREKHGFVGTKRLCELHFHMIGQDSIEGAIFGGYLDVVRRNHPDATLPGLFADDELFAMAARQIDELGADAFFAPMNTGGRAAPKGWGDVARVWDRARFDTAVASADPKVREELFDALVRHRYAGWDRRSRGFVDLDNGLATVSRHAAELGYDGLVLFLDELILWLSGRAADYAWLHGEVHKMVKLVEAANMHRPVPLVSFIARQRNLSEMVGEDYVGADAVRLSESLRHWEGRYDKVELEDKNLPAIVERRVLRKKAGAEATLREAFERMKRTAGPAWGTLLGQDDQAAFEKLYPFSPALVDVLVALSNSLQRQRTAIKLLMEMLVEHIEDLPVGEVVRVGDLFDLLAAGEASADGIMKARFESARQIYQHQLLPMIREQNKTASPAECQRLRDGHPLRIGCSNCPQRACRTDNRLVKTLLVAALVPEVKAVKDLTASRLVQLNHGSLKVPIAGTEASIVAQKLRGWAAQIGQLAVGSEPDPVVRIRLDGIDVGPILARAQSADSPGARQRVVRELLFEALGIQKVVDKGKDHKVTWRGTDRVGHVHFGNVRTMGPDQLRCADGDAWRIVVDYPFDEERYGPSHDLEVVQRFTESEGSWTLVWLPSFFSPAVEKLLGELAILEEISGKLQVYISDLSVENQKRAAIDLDNLTSMKKARVMNVLEEAYGLLREKEGDLDTARSLDQHLHLLKAGARLEVPPVPNLSEAITAYVQGLLAARWPRHPDFREKLSGTSGSRLVEELLTRFGELVDSPERRLPADRTLIDEMRGTFGELGMVRVSESAIHLVEDRALLELENQRRKAADDAPTVAQIARWFDESGRMGLEPAAVGLIVRAYARWSARTLTHFGKPYVPQPGKPIPGDVVLEKPELPGQADWQDALEQAGAAFGIALPGKALHADNLKRFEAAVASKLGELAAAATALPGALARWAELVGVPPDADRLRTARAADALCASLNGQRGVALVHALASARLETSARAVGSSLSAARAQVDVLGQRIRLGVVQQLAARASELPGGAALLERLAATLRQDEVNQALAERARALSDEAQELLAGPAPQPPSRDQLQFAIRGRGRAALAELDRVLDEARAAIDAAGESAIVEGTITVRRST